MLFGGQLETCIFESLNLVVLEIGSNFDKLDDRDKWCLLNVRVHDNPIII